MYKKRINQVVDEFFDVVLILLIAGMFAFGVLSGFSPNSLPPEGSYNSR